MKRNLDLIRLLLIEIERCEESCGSSDLTADGFTSPEVAYHVGLLAQAGYLDVATLRNQPPEPTLYQIRGMTYRGHDYLDAVRKAGVWNRVKDAAEKQGISLTLDLAKEYAVSYIRQQLGLIAS